MQLTPRYLVSNRITIVANLAGFVTEYRPVYSRQVKVYKGIDNVLQFRLLNADQRPVDTAGYIPKFVAIDDNNMLAIEKDGVIQDDESSSIRGLFTVTLTENDLMQFEQQYLKYNIYLEDAAQQNILTYSHSNFDNNATIFIDTGAFPNPKPSLSLSEFRQENTGSVYWFTGAVDAQPNINSNEALHSAAIYADSFVGDIIVQGTLDPQVSEGTSWADIQQVIFTGTETEPKPVNVTGNFSYFRFMSIGNPTAAVTKILIRN